ncbi:hypothetical protein P5G50_00535 [Leifsonia sp. F6_8S_P_1B]|uniref:Uncharacterized protein n=1 Tax=Leifsonia williamsii TaxID=3035919 RepID=A0ABT8K659_9MICO|nr:hypothetical protein [Leifsonia williamsii]MDN4612921.1 hypothetical protein [Leifsonia williamsii]
MTLDAAALLDGPRGRRLALEAALQSFDGDDPDHWLIGASVMRLAGDLDVSSGRSTVTFTLVPEGEPEPPEPEWLTVPQLATVLAAAPVAGLPSLLPALTSAVDSARYWQEPDGEDVLAALPELRPALLRVMEAVLAHPDARTWGEPIEPRDQWEVVFETPEGMRDDVPADVDADAAADPDWAEWREEAVAEEFAAATDRPTDPEAPWSGAWWSIPFTRPATLTTTRTLAGAPAGLRLVEDGFGWDRAVSAPVRVEGASVYEVDSPEAWAGLCRRFPLTATASHRHDWYRTTGRAGVWLRPDWAAVAQHYDGVHLSVAGYLRLAGRAIPVTEEAASVIAGWSPDETYWLRRERVRVGVEDRVEWRRGDDGEWEAVPAQDPEANSVQTPTDRNPNGR